MGAILHCDQDQPVLQVTDACVQALKAQKTIVVPTDSVYGIAAAATPANPGYQDIFTLKQRPATQTLPWLIADASELGIYGQKVDPRIFQVVKRFWPGPLTVVVKASFQVPEEYLGPDHTIALLFRHRSWSVRWSVSWDTLLPALPQTSMDILHLPALTSWTLH